MSMTRSNSDEVMLDSTSPRTDIIPVTGHTPSSRSSFTDAFTYNDSTIATMSISTDSNQSQSPLFARPSFMHASHRPQHDHTIDDRPWDSQTVPCREQSTAWSLIQDGNTGERGFRHLNGPSPYAADHATSASAASRIIPVEDTYIRRRSLLPSPTSPVDPRSRILPPPPGLGSKHAHPDSLQSSRPPQQPPNIPSARPHLAQRRSSLSLPPIRIQKDGYSDERRQPR
ncbi:hypothetical protein BDZ85DRAFT_136579 [Elsinoe ampelina]|uniref:Uncharacterized protein n=1 Tax=Elsinoe ampelina TaxID=302913 RepID=A0A6A6G8Q9_9PEZI|nr:hypothetical protein BDZ85DRAFT_136579 [Elsinoe ampelina]